MKFYISCLILLFCQFQSNNTATNLCECGEDEGGKHSWHTLIYVQDGSGDFKTFCNGILTSPWTVITAYTCIHNGLFCAISNGNHFQKTFLQLKRMVQMIPLKLALVICLNIPLEQRWLSSETA